MLVQQACHVIVPESISKENSEKKRCVTFEAKIVDFYEGALAKCVNFYFVSNVIRNSAIWQSNERNCIALPFFVSLLAVVDAYL